MTQGELLYDLQDLDQELEAGERRTTEIRASLAEPDALRQGRRAVQAAKEKYRDWITRARDLELEVESLNSKIDRSEERLYSGSVTNPKELSDIQSEIASLKRRRGALEDELLEAMVNSDDAEATLNAHRANLSTGEAEWQAEHSALAAELEELEAWLEAMRAEHAELRTVCAPDDLAQYDRVRSRYGSVAVTTMRDGVCGYCAVAPSSTKLARIRGGRELLQCGNCGRILLELD